MHVFRPSHDSSVWLGSKSREQLMSPECSKNQVLSFAKMLVVCWTNKKYSVLISVLQSAQWINSECIYPHSVYICICIRTLLHMYIVLPMYNYVHVYMVWLCQAKTYSNFLVFRKHLFLFQQAFKQQRVLFHSSTIIKTFP